MPKLTKEGVDAHVLRPKFGDKAVTRGHVAGVIACRHQFVTIFEQTQQVFCRNCKEEVDAFLVLQALARVWEHVTYAEREAEELERRAVEAKREADNARSRTRGAIKKAPDSRAEHYFAELLRRLEGANNYEEIQAATRWAASFKWLEPAQYETLKDAHRHAAIRADEHARRVNKARKAGVKVIDGGKAG